jgi:uncharacterized protein YoxC
MSLEEDVQQVIMQAIQDLESSLQELAAGSGAVLEAATPGDSFVTSHMAQLQEEARTASALKEQMAQRCHELDQQAAILQVCSIMI